MIVNFQVIHIVNYKFVTTKIEHVLLKFTKNLHIGEL